MQYIEPHIHMISRTTDDYQRMTLAGCVACTEPAFWAGYDRPHPQAFADYFEHLTTFEPARAAKYGIAHHCWLCINPKEAENVDFAREVLQVVRQYLDRPTVVGIGEIGLNKNSRNELTILEAQIALALEHNQLILVHTPHMEDKLKGARLTLDVLKALGADPDRVIIDHMEEHTMGLVRDAGFWAGMTLYPDTKFTPQRAVDTIERFGGERLWINSSADWAYSDPLLLPQTRLEMQRRGHSDAMIQKVLYDNPLSFLSQSGKFKVSVG
jgi:predicted metal-dependent TIM-barrel fold hydrolase